jgi:Rrf2 family protein
MLALTKKVDYGLIALCHLTRHRDQVHNAREIAERYRLPQALLMNILKILSHKGLINSTRGPKGGYELAVEPATVNLSDIIEALEGPIRFVQCAAMESDSPGARTQPCELRDACPISAPVLRLHKKLKAFLTGVTLAEMASEADFSAAPIPVEVNCVATPCVARESDCDEVPDLHG